MKRVLLFLMLLMSSVAFATVTNQSVSITFSCSGSTGPYAFSFPISDPTALTVTQDGVVLSSSTYTVTPVNNNYANGGSVTLNVACNSPSTLVLERVTPVTQTTVYTDNMPTPMKTFERSLDKLTEISIEQQNSFGNWTCPGGEVATGFTANEPVCGTIAPAGATWESPGTLGSITPNTIAWTYGTSILGTSVSPITNADGTSNAKVWRYDATPAYNSSARIPLGLPANAGSAINANIWAPNTNLDLVMTGIFGVQCGTPDAPLATLPASNAKVGLYTYGGATSDGACAPMGANIVVAGYPAHNSSIFGSEIDWNGNGSDVAANLATAPNYSALKLASGGPKKGGAWISSAATNFPTNGMQYGSVMAHWLTDGYVCLWSTGAASTCYYAAPAGNASTGLGSQAASTAFAAQNHRWNGATDVADIGTIVFNPNSAGTDSCWELKSASGVAITKSCGLFAGTAAVFGGSTTLAAQFPGSVTVTGYDVNNAPGLALTPANNNAGTAFVIKDSGGTAQFIAQNNGSLFIGDSSPAVISGSTGKGTFNGGVLAGNAAAPTCDASHRGIFWYVPGGAGVKDVVEVCAKDAADAYAWRSIY